MNTTQASVDLAKSVFQIAISTTPGRIDAEHRLTRRRFERFFAEQAPMEVLMEACGMSHHWGRELEALGHSVRLLPPSDVARYRDGNKTDRADALALLEASRNERIDDVPVKTVEQQALASLHRLRYATVGTRTARINLARGILREFGYTLPQGAARFVAGARNVLDEADLPLELADELRRVLDEIEALKQTIRELTTRIEGLGTALPAVALLRTVPGIGVLTATALVALVGEPTRFPSGRHFASYLGLTPRESSSGLRRRLGRISKRGNTYLRMLLIHGARAALLAAHRTDRPDTLQQWALGVEARTGHNKAAVALANRLARIAWRVWRDERPYERRFTHEASAHGGHALT
jgi:transposase